MTPTALVDWPRPYRRFGTGRIDTRALAMGRFLPAVTGPDAFLSASPYICHGIRS